MAIHLTRIYTRAGDDGTTALGDMSRVAKTDPRVGAYAECEETNAAIGAALALGALPERIAQVLRVIQNDLFDVGADLCTPGDPSAQGTPPSGQRSPLRITDEYVERLEEWCDQFNEQLSKLDSFILPGGTAGAALLHQARTVARRAERSAWMLYEAEPQRTGQQPLRYLNRLSDLLFILARCTNDGHDVLWQPGGAR